MKIGENNWIDKNNVKNGEMSKFWFFHRMNNGIFLLLWIHVIERFFS